VQVKEFGSLEHGRVNAAHASTCNIGILHVLQVLNVARQSKLLKSQLWIAVGSMRSMILQTVKVLVALATDFAAIGLLLLHADSARVWNGRQRVDDRKATVVILLELLVLMAVLFVVFQSILVLVCLLASYDWAFEWFDLLWEGELRYACSVEQLLLS